MTLLLGLLLLALAVIPLAFSEESFNSHAFPRPLIIEYSQPPSEASSLDEGVRLRCTSWRFAAETNNLNPWKTIPEECAEYVGDYMTGKGYSIDLERASTEAGKFAKSVELRGDGKDVWIFDIDETLLSNLPYYAQHLYGLEVFNHAEFNKWVEKGTAPAIDASLKLYEQVLDLGFKVFLLTGRTDKHRDVTVENLVIAGVKNWDKLILRTPDERSKLATVFKSEKRDEMVKEGYRIIGDK